MTEFFKRFFRVATIFICLMVALQFFQSEVGAQSVINDNWLNLSVVVPNGFYTLDTNGQGICDGYVRPADSTVVILCRQPNSDVASNPRQFWFGAKQGFLQTSGTEIGQQYAQNKDTSFNGAFGEDGIFFFTDKYGVQEFAYSFVGQDGNDAISYLYITPVNNDTGSEPYDIVKTIGTVSGASQ